MNALELNDISRYQEHGRPVLEAIDLTLEPGEVVGLLGENGAGKTTLIRIALGMLQAQKGSVRLFGSDPRESEVELRQRIGYVSEDQALPPYLRVRDALELHAALYPTWDAQLARELLDQFGLEDKRRIGRLSKGQARRVAVVCAIAHRPELLLLDEPAGGFDPAARREFLETALRLLSEEGSAVLFSSHHLADVERLASRVVFLHRGRKFIDAPLDSLREASHLAVFASGNGLRRPDLLALESCRAARVVGEELRGTFVASEATVRGELAQLEPHQEPHLRPVSLEDLFIELVEGTR